MYKLIVCLFYLCIQINLMAEEIPSPLTYEEHLWLQAHPVINVGIDTNFFPFEFVDEKGEFKGISADYLQEMEKNLGIHFTIIKTKPWNEIIAMVKEKQIDFLSCIVKTDQRAEYLNFTQPYLSFPMVIVTNTTSGYIGGLDDLKHKTVAVIEGYTPEELLGHYYKDILLVKTKDLKEALELVSFGQTFAHVGNLPRIIYTLKKEGFNNLAISGITQYQYNFAMGSRKDEPILQSILQKSFDAIPKKTKDAIYYKWFPIKYTTTPNYTVVFWEVLIFVVVIGAFIAFWMYKLHKEIQKRKFAEKQLQKNAHWLNNSLKTANIGAWSWDVRTNVITGNSVYSTVLGFGDKEIEITMNDFQKNFIHKDDLSLVLKEMERCFNKESDACFARFRVHTKSGKLQTIESTSKIFEYDVYNNPIIVIGFIKEITV